MQSIESIPTWFSTYFNITLGSAQVILSCIVLLSVMIPVMILSKNRGHLIDIIMLFLVEGLLVGIGWFPFWFLIATVVLISFMVARMGVDAILSGG